MKRVLLAGVSFAALAGTALAADIPVQAVPPPAPVAVPYDWTGFYAGLHRGSAWAETDVFHPVTGRGNTLKPEGSFLGGQIGFNWQAAPNWVWGVEADYAVAKIEDIGREPVTLDLAMQTKLDRFATVRGRLGYVNDRTLWYVTGGWAWGSVEHTFLTPGSFRSQRNSHSGWTAGVGLERMIAPNWSLKTEYLYLDLGEKRFEFFAGEPHRGSLTAHTVKAGLNYRFGAGGPDAFAANPAPYTKAPVAALFSWAGFYFGGHGGYAWADAETRFLPSGDSNTIDPDGSFAGLQLGYNWQTSPNWVWGIEADVATANIEAVGNEPVSGSLPLQAKMDMFGTVRLRAGYAADRTLWYVTGGGAWATVEARLLTPGAFQKVTDTRFGWTAGAGVEHAIAPNWTVKAEYLYLDLGDDTYNFPLTFPGSRHNVDITAHTVKFGANYRF